MYDPAIGRWHVVDPLSESTVAWTPYRYGLNNPIINIDPDGRSEINLGYGQTVDSRDFAGSVDHYSMGDGPIGGGDEEEKPDNWYRQNGTNNVIYQEGSAEIDGYENLGEVIGTYTPDGRYLIGLDDGSVIIITHQIGVVGGDRTFAQAYQSSKSTYAPLAEFYTDLITSVVPIASLTKLAKVSKFVAGSRLIGAAKGSKTFFDGAKYSPKVLRQMSKGDDLFHGFPKSVDGYATKFGQWSTKVGADGKTYQWLNMQGSYGGKTGTFEFIKDANGVINHRFFNIH